MLAGYRRKLLSGQVHFALRIPPNTDAGLIQDPLLWLADNTDLNVHGSTHISQFLRRPQMRGSAKAQRSGERTNAEISWIAALKRGFPDRLPQVHLRQPHAVRIKRKGLPHQQSITASFASGNGFFEFLPIRSENPVTNLKCQYQALFDNEHASPITELPQASSLSARK
jgi:hypothetical protein